MIVTKPTQAAAQELADRCHSYLIANDQNYAESVALGHTTAWAIPYQAEGSSDWSVPVAERVNGCLTAEELG